MKTTPASVQKTLWSNVELTAIAQRQRRLILALPVTFCGCVMSCVVSLFVIKEPVWSSLMTHRISPVSVIALLLGLSVIALLVVAVLVGHLARVLRCSPLAMGVCALVPLLNLLAIARVCSKATAVLEHHGISVGVFGARQRDLESFG